MKFGKSNSTPTTGSKTTDYPKGVFVDLVTINNIENQKSQYYDCNVRVETVADFNGYEKNFYLGGNHVKDGEIFIGWGSKKTGVEGAGSWVVQSLITTATGIKETDIDLNNDGTIADNTLKACIGKKIHILQYETDGPYRKTWMYVGNEEGGKDYLYSKWASSKKAGRLPRNYKYGEQTDTATEVWQQSQKKETANSGLPF